jgi:hypothetical protein
MHYHYNNYARILAPVYFMFGRHALLLKIGNAVVSVLSLLMLFLIAGKLFSHKAALYLLSAMAIWPSHVYWSSQIFRESFVWLGIFLTIYGAIGAREEFDFKNLFLVSVGLTLTGLLRTYDLLPLSVFVFLMILFFFTGDRAKPSDDTAPAPSHVFMKSSKGLLLLLPVLAILFVAYTSMRHEDVTTLQVGGPQKNRVYSLTEPIAITWGKEVNAFRFDILLKEVGRKKKAKKIAELDGQSNSYLFPPPGTDYGDTPLRIIVRAYDRDGRALMSGWSKMFYVSGNAAIKRAEVAADDMKSAPKKKKSVPEKLSDKRKLIIDSLQMDRPPNTLIFPDYTFHSYGELFLFIPKSAWYVMFMPLPGLYEVDSLGRILASVENSVLLLMSLLGVAGIFRARKDARHYAVIAAFLFFVMIHAISDPDLGAAMRHKASYISLLLLFGTYEMAGLFSRRERTARGKSS